MSELYLQHYGVKGMKWGVRRIRAKEQTGVYKSRDKFNALDAKYQTTPRGKRTEKLKTQRDNARLEMIGSKAKYKARGGIYKNKKSGAEKYSSKRVGELKERYGQGAVKRLAKNTKKGKVSSVAQQEKREAVRKFVNIAAASTAITAVAGVNALRKDALGRQVLNFTATKAAQKVAPAARVAKKVASNFRKQPAASPIAVRNLEPIANLPAALRSKK